MAKCECLHCNRSFPNREALKQHIASSGVEHPSCTACDRRFNSQAACDAHMAAKHPPTFPCDLCSRSYSSVLALQDHYRGSAAHPNCSKCGQGFRDRPERDEHHRVMHPRAPCGTCGGILVYQDSMEDHYLKSSSHPTCIKCGRGFKDSLSLAEHDTSAHPRLKCEPCHREFETEGALQDHYFASLNHPECVICHRGLRDDQEYHSHMETHSSLLNVQPDFDDCIPDYLSSPFILPVRRSKPKGSNSRTSDAAPSPVMSMSGKDESPLMEVQSPFAASQSTLPPPGIGTEQAWAARDNVQVPTSQLNTASTWPLQPLSTLNGQQSGGHTAEESASASASVDSGHSRSSVFTKNSTSTNAEEDPNMDSSRTRNSRKESLNQINPGSNPEGSFSTNNSPTNDAQLSWRTRQSMFGGTSPLSPSLPFKSGDLSNFGKINKAGRHVSRPGRLNSKWRQELADRLRGVTPQPSELHASQMALLSGGDNVDYPSADDLISPMCIAEDDNEPTAPKPGDTAGKDQGKGHHQGGPPKELVTTDQCQSQTIKTQPYPPLLDDELSKSDTGSSNHTSLSPDIPSPPGFSAISSLSVPNSSISVNEAQVADATTTGIITETATQKRPRPLSSEDEGIPRESFMHTTSFSTRVNHAESYTTNSTKSAAYFRDSFVEPEIPAPEEKSQNTSKSADARRTDAGRAFLLPKPPSELDSEEDPDLGRGKSLIKGVKVVKDAKDRGISMSQPLAPSIALDSDTDSDAVLVTAPETPLSCAPSPKRSGADPAHLAARQKDSNLSLRCRMPHCVADPCVEPTVTMCGHLFCYGCITKEITHASRCPVCTTPTLLYCLFRLHLTN